MPNVVQTTVENPDELLNAGAYGAGALIRLQTSPTQTGAYADVTGVGATPTLTIITGVRSYTGYDPTGAAASWYRTRVENVGATRVSDWSTSFQVGPEGAGLICSLYDVKQELGSTSTADDETLLEKIRQIGAEIMNITGRRFVRMPASGTTTFLFDVRHPSWVRSLPVPQGIAEASLLEVAVSSQPEIGGVYSTVPTAEWWLRPVIAERTYGWPPTSIAISDLSGSYFAIGSNTVRVTMGLGWPAIPPDIQAIALRAVVGSYLSKGSGAGGMAAVGPTGAMTVLRFISPADRELLTAYTNIP